jgi:NAD(P)-dependent dehydrogenase (short-subunit alcohol dehydrogenase family)
MSGLLSGRVALVTGAARGLGRTIGEAFAAAGATGALLDLPAALGASPAPSGFLHRSANVADESDLAAAVADVMARFGRLDIVVANAGLVPLWRDTAALDMVEWDRVFAVNVRGVAATLKHAAPAMRQTGGAMIVMCSINSFRAAPGQMLYTASKHAALGIVRAAALDLGPHGIRVNGLAPGPIATEALLERLNYRESIGGPLRADALAAFGSGTALRRMATAEEVANAALFLASDLSTGITGCLFPIDAGLA